MELTSYLKNKLMNLYDTFTHKGEKFTVTSYGGDGNNSFIYWDGDKGTTIIMHYAMNKVGQDRYKGVKNILDIDIY